MRSLRFFESCLLTFLLVMKLLFSALHIIFLVALEKSISGFSPRRWSEYLLNKSVPNKDQTLWLGRLSSVSYIMVSHAYFAVHGEPNHVATGSLTINIYHNLKIHIRIDSSYSGCTSIFLVVHCHDRSRNIKLKRIREHAVIMIATLEEPRSQYIGLLHPLLSH